MDIDDPVSLRRAITGVDVVVNAVRLRGELAPAALVDLYERIVEATWTLAGSSVSIVTVGGAGALNMPDGTRFWQASSFFPTYSVEEKSARAVARHVEASPAELPWVYLVPPPDFDPDGPHSLGLSCPGRAAAVTSVEAMDDFLTPTVGQGRARGQLLCGDRVAGGGVHRVGNPCDGPPGVRALTQDHRIPCLQEVRRQDPQIPAGTPTGPDAWHEVGHPPTAGGFPARSARLTDLQAYCAHVPDITEADIVFGQALHNEVLAEGPRAHRGTVQLLLPARVVLGRVGEHRFFRSTVMTTVGLFITGDAVLSDPDRGGDGGLVDRTDPRPAGI